MGPFLVQTLEGWRGGFDTGSAQRGGFGLVVFPASGGTMCREARHAISAKRVGQDAGFGSTIGRNRSEQVIEV